METQKEIELHQYLVDLTKTTKFKLPCTFIGFYNLWIKLYRLPETEQPQHVDSFERDMILFLRKSTRFSVEDLAEVFERSKQTIHSVLHNGEG